MHNNTSIAEKLPAILELARYAPSVHNTQPWLVAATDHAIEVEIDRRHALAEGDPTGRQTIISLGIFCEALSLAAAHYGFNITSVALHDTGARLHVAHIEKTGHGTDKSIELLRRRSTDRSIYQPAPLDHRTIAAIQNSADQDGVAVRVVTDRKAIQLIAGLTSRGIGLALSNPDFRKELSRYLVLPWSKKKRGIAVKSLYIAWPLAVMQPLLMKLGIGLGAEGKTELKRWLSASGVVVISADGDLAAHWFKAGRAYLRASLAIESAGLSQATSAAIVEASTYHEDLEEFLHTNQRVLALIRVGKGAVHRQYSPRLSASELLH